MEKLIYPLWRPEAQGADTFRDDLLAMGSTALADARLRGLRIAVADGGVAAAAHRRMATTGFPTQGLPDAMLSAWVDSAGDRQVLEAALAPVVRQYCCYLVTEAEPLVNRAHPPAAGGRVPGMCQVVFLQRPGRLGEQEWLAIWKDSHTSIAIDTQSTFAYRQNVIERALSEDAPALDAMIEESFPAAAMSSDHAFYGVPDGDDAALQANLEAMLGSCARFIDFDRIEVIPMSEYVLKPLFAAP